MSSSHDMKIKLRIWRQKSPKSEGKFVDYEVNRVSPDMSFLEMLDVLNQDLIKRGDDPVAFEHDCREGICGSCAMVINGDPHGPQRGTTVCQLHMRTYADGDTVVVEPWRATAFPILKDLVTDRTALDRMVQVGGYVSVNTGSARDGNGIPVRKESADLAFDAAACISCGACVAACKNASAMLFVAAKVSHLSHLPQGKTEAKERAIKMVAQMDAEGFGACTNTRACSAACPKEISQEHIAHLNREFFKASMSERPPKDILGD